MLGQFGGAQVGKQNRTIQPLIEILQHGAGPFRFDPDHYAIGMENVLYGFSFLQELRIRGYVELGMQSPGASASLAKRVTVFLIHSAVIAGTVLFSTISL